MALNAVFNERLQSKEQLLAKLATTVGFLIEITHFNQSVFVIWSGLNHLHSRVKSILRHGSRIRHHLIFAQPSFAAFDSWLEARLLDHSLVEELVKNRTDICHNEFYYDWAFLRDETLFNQFVGILNVLASRDLNALCDIEIITAELVFSARKRKMDNPSTTVEIIGQDLMSTITEEKQEKASCSSSAVPTTHKNPSIIIADNFDLPSTSTSQSQDELEETRTIVIDTDDEEEPSSSSNLSIPIFSYASLSPVCSPPEFSHIISGGGLVEDETFFETSHHRQDPEGCSSQEASCSSVKSTKPGRPSSATSTQPKIVLASPPPPTTNKLLQPTFSENVLLGGSSSDIRKNSISREKSPEVYRKAYQPSFLESGYRDIQPPAFGNFPLPQKGQSLTSFLSSLSDSMPELDRENAHFNVSEALISAFEVARLKVDRTGSRKIIRQSTPLIPDEMEYPEDMFGSVEHSKEFNNTKPPHLSLTEPDSTRKFYSGRRFPRPPIQYTETEESEVEYWRQQPRRPPTHLRKKPRAGKLGSDGHSVSLMSTTEISSTSSDSQQDTEDDLASSSFCAENVALNLLRNAKMKEEHLPPASELQWLVSEAETPQSLLPLPKNWATSASEGSENEYSGKFDGSSVRLRGTAEWAPPRPQIIFTVHPSPSSHILTEIQRYRCAGCGMRVDPKYISTFRYCFYLGRYFCTGCHTGKKARLPQLILHKWDFSPYLVSNFSYQLLESLQSDPVYNALAINPNLTKKVKLNNFRNYRIQLHLFVSYLKNCKSAESLYQDFQKFPSYYTADVDMCSLEDLINVRFSTGLPMILKDFIAEATRHVLNCQLCSNLGFVCEICSRSEVIFPFQINRASRCPKCFSCYHLKCFNSNLSDCPKCLRVTKRRDTLEISPASIAV